MDAATLAQSRVLGDKRYLRGNTIVLLGNSRIARELVSGSPSYASERGIFGLANAKLGGRFKVLNYAGINGDTLTGMIARWATDVGAYRPEWVLLADPVNDATNARTAAQMIADTQTLIALNKGIGARTILLLAPPNGNHTTAAKQALNDFNRWAKWSLSDGWVVPVDVASPVTGAGDGNWTNPYSNDQLHQNRAGSSRMARTLAAVLDRLVPPRDPFPSSPVDSKNAALNPWFFVATPGVNMPASWVRTGTGTFTSILRTDAACNGCWVQIDTTTSGASTLNFLNQNMNPLSSSPFAVGDKVRLIVEFQSDAPWTSLTQLKMNAQFFDVNGAATGDCAALGVEDAAQALAAQADQWGGTETWVFQSPPFAVPANTTTYRLIDTWQGVGKVRFGRHALIAA